MDEADQRQIEEDIDVEIDNFEGMSDDEKADLRATCRPVKFMLVKLRKLAYKVIHSTTKLLPAWLKCLRDHGLPETYIPRDVSTRWNSTYDMLEYVVEHAKPLKAYLGDEDHTFDLDVFALSSQEWRCARQLRKVLKATLNRYYSLTDQSDTYRIAMVLHPRHKLQYFRKNGWTDEWIATAEAITRTTWEDKYKNVDVPDAQDDVAMQSDTSDSVCCLLCSLYLTNVS
ncbi:hypothetical protein GGF50DRAFT_56515 [Schizophyllum commune]